MWGKFHDQRGLVQLQYFLRVISEDSPPDAETKTGDWFLYKIETGKTVIMHQGHGVDNYKKLLKELEGQGLQPDQIMWGDPSHPYGINSPMLE